MYCLIFYVVFAKLYCPLGNHLLMGKELNDDEDDVFFCILLCLISEKIMFHELLMFFLP